MQGTAPLRSRWRAGVPDVLVAYSEVKRGSAEVRAFCVPPRLFEQNSAGSLPGNAKAPRDNANWACGLLIQREIVEARPMPILRPASPAPSGWDSSGAQDPLSGPAASPFRASLRDPGGNLGRARQQATPGALPHLLGASKAEFRRGTEPHARMVEAGEVLFLNSLIPDEPYTVTAETLCASQVGFLPAYPFFS